MVILVLYYIIIHYYYYYCVCSNNERDAKHGRDEGPWSYHLQVSTTTHLTALRHHFEPSDRRAPILFKLQRSCAFA